MQIKKFEAPTMNEALQLIKTELGPDAIILSTKNHKKGFGLLSKASVEVTAAISDKSLAKKKVTEKMVPEQIKQQLNRAPAGKQAEVYEEVSGFYTNRAQARQQASAAASAQSKAQAAAAQQARAQQAAQQAAAQRAAVAASAASASRQSSGGGQRYVDISDDDVAGPVQARSSAYGRNGRLPSAQTAAPAPSASASMQNISQSNDRSNAVVMNSMVTLQEDVERLKTIIEELKSEQSMLSDGRLQENSSEQLQEEFKNLLRNGIDKKLATQLIKTVGFTLENDEARSTERVVDALALEIMNSLKIEDTLSLKELSKQAGLAQRVVALVGPTGVGKTTTVAKLASQAILQYNLKVGLINVDTYKVGASDQLAAYAKILNTPFRHATSIAELDRALAEFKPLDLILIDTSGRSQKDSESLAQMKSVLADFAKIESVLILNSTTRDQELYDMITRFKIFDPQGIIFSKLDEASTFGTIYNVCVRSGLPLTYFTVGQRVPEDIESASRERVASLILDL